MSALEAVLYTIGFSLYGVGVAVVSCEVTLVLLSRLGVRS